MRSRFYNPPRMIALRNRLVVVAALIAVCAALPVVAVIAGGIAPGATQTLQHLAQTVLPEAIANTLLLVVLVGVGAGIGGTITGWLVAQRRFPGSYVFEWALLLPLAMPAYVMAYAYTDFLQYAGPLQTALRETFGWSRNDYWFPEVRSVGGAALMFIFSLYPYVYLIARTAFIERPDVLVEAARTMGVNARGALWRIDLPFARPAIAAGIALVLMETLSDYGTVAYFAVDTFTTGIYRSWFSFGDRVAAAQLAMLLLLFVVAAIVLERTSRRARRSGATRAAVPSARPRLTGVKAATATLACGIPLAIGFLIPVLLLVRLLAGEDGITGSRFVFWAWNSLRVAALGATLAVGVALVIAYAARLSPGRITRNVSQLLTLGYAVPGTVLAVGVLLPIGALDRLLASAIERMTGSSPGLVFTGTVMALLYAYVVRYFAVAWNGIEPGFLRITPAMDAAARSLGANIAQTFRRVHAPLLTRSVAATFLLVFVDIMKELPATLVLRPFNFDTLATQTYQFARDERLAEAALPSLAIVLVGLVPIALLAKADRRVRRLTVTGAAPV
ncbi:MAG TPA: iron ABC transporter permease [Casimicrobiaceae bacterium]|nr:iron ABC transporter permease [Casimicrobiaceae bacterium]